jgi:hypothetical protein
MVSEAVATETMVLLPAFARKSEWVQTQFAFSAVNTKKRKNVLSFWY